MLPRLVEEGLGAAPKSTPGPVTVGIYPALEHRRTSNSRTVGQAVHEHVPAWSSALERHPAMCGAPSGIMPWGSKYLNIMARTFQLGTLRMGYGMNLYFLEPNQYVNIILAVFWLAGRT